MLKIKSNLIRNKIFLISFILKYKNSVTIKCVGCVIAFLQSLKGKFT